MGIEKYLAGILTALMAVSVFSVSALAELKLKDYPVFFGKEIPLVVVGEKVDSSDVVGAIDVAVTLAQLSTQPVPVPGVEPKVNGKEIELVIRGSQATDVVVDASSYSKLLREVVKDSKGIEHYVLEQAIMAGNKLKSQVINVTHYLDVDAEGVKYKISFTPSMPIKEKVTILGVPYEIIEITDTVLKLGETTTLPGLGVGSEGKIGPYSFTIEDRAKSPDRAVVAIYKDGNFLQRAIWENGGSYSYDEGKFRVEIPFLVITVEDKLMVDVKLVYVNKIVEEGKDSPFDPNYKVPSGGIVNDTAGLISLELVSKLDTVESPTAEGQIPLIKPDESFAGPADYFKILYRGLTPRETEKILFDKEGFVIYNDKNRLEEKVSVSKLQTTGKNNATAPEFAKDDVIGVSGYAVVVKDVAADGANFTLKHRAWEHTFTTADVGKEIPTGYGFSVTLTAFSPGTNFNATIANSSAEVETSLGAKINKTGVIEESGEVVVVTYDAATKKYNVSAATEVSLTTENTKGLSDYGSEITLGAARETVEIIYPDEPRKARALLGELKEVVAPEVEKYVPIVQPVGKQANEVDPTKNHLILIGGTCANDLTAQFYGLPKGAPATERCGLEAVNKTMGIKEDEAVIEVKEGVFAANKTVMVVAGFEKEETRLAARFVQLLLKPELIPTAIVPKLEQSRLVFSPEELTAIKAI